jgi:hypothetical protein
MHYVANGSVMYPLCYICYPYFMYLASVIMHHSQVDVEDYDGQVMHGLRRVIELGLPPLIKIEFMGIAGDYVSLQCRGSGLLRWLYGLGYHAYTPGVRRPLEMQEWEDVILPLLLQSDFETLQKKHGIPRIVELMVVHDSAPVPAIIGAPGPGGAGDA